MHLKVGFVVFMCTHSMALFLKTHRMLCVCRIQKEGIDPALLEQAIAEPNVDIDLARAKSSVKLLEEQFKQLQPDLATIAE